MEYEVGLKLYERVKEGRKLVQPEKQASLTSAQVAFKLRRRVLERRAPQLPGRASPAAASRRAASDRVRCSLLLLASATAPAAPDAGQDARTRSSPSSRRRPSSSRSSSGTSSRWTARIGRDRAADRQEPQRPVPAGPPVPPRRALRGEEPVRLLPPGGAARPESNKGAMVSARRPSCSSRRRCSSTTACSASSRTSRTRDKVTFYLAHEQRELGQFDEMLKTLGELIAQVPQEPAAARVGADHRRLLLRQDRPRRGREALPGHPRAPASPGARPRPLQDGVDPRQPEQARGRGHLLRGRRRQRADPRGGQPEGAQRQARGAAGPGLQLHRGPAAQGRPPLLREALRQPRRPTRWRWTSSATATSSSSSTSGPSPRSAS